MSSLIFLLLLTQSAPPQDYAGKAPNFALQQQRHYSQAQKILTDQPYTGLFGKGTCFTMRSYVFTRQDGDAPVLVGATTCTPASTLRVERTRQPQVRLIPAD